MVSPKQCENNISKTTDKERWPVFNLFVFITSAYPKLIVLYTNQQNFAYSLLLRERASKIMEKYNETQLT